jgi:hypothetical protein
MTIRSVVLPLLAIAATAAAAAAQRQVSVFFGATTGGAFGRSIVAAPDRSGDGPDLIVGMPEWLNSAGRAVWINGQSGQILSAAIGTGITTRLGTTIAAAGDLNLDGTQDWVVGAPRADYAGIDAGYVAAISGATGAILWTRNGGAGHRWGTGLCSLGDLNGDGRHEIAVSAPFVDIGQVSILNGATGATIRTFNGDPFARFGAAIALFRPLGTGPVRLLVSEPLVGGTAGRVWLIDPWQPPAAAAQWFRNGNTGDGLGERLATFGDHDNDGTPDFLCSRANGRVDIRSGVDGALLHTFTGNATDDFGFAFASAGDLDRDGKLDVAIGAPGTNIQNGAATVYSGATLAPLFSLAGAPGSRFGEAFAALGDLDGDQWPDLAIGAPAHFQSGLGGVGRVSVHAWTVDGAAIPYGTACTGTLPQVPLFTASQAPRLGGNFDLKVNQAPANTIALFVQGLSNTQVGSLALPFDLGVLGAPGCAQRTSMDALDFALTNSAGSATYVIQVPTAPALAGFRWFTQGALLTPANTLGLVTTAGLELVIGHP